MRAISHRDPHWLTERGGQRIAANLRRVFAVGDSRELSLAAYRFVILHMGHIAHNDRDGFASAYADLRNLTRSLQTSEYSADLGYNLRWADELDRRYREDPDRGHGASPAVTATIRALVGAARAYGPGVAMRAEAQQRDRELGTARALAARYGYSLTPAGG